MEKLGNTYQYSTDQSLHCLDHTGWPKGHNFQLFKLEIEDIFMINWFGGPKPLTVDQYLKYKL